MKKTLWIVALASASLALFFGQTSYAGGRSDGGGNVVVCFKTRAQKEKVQRQGRIVEDEDLKFIESIDLLEIYDMEKHLSPLNGRTLVQFSSESAEAEAQRVFDYYRQQIDFGSAIPGQAFKAVMDLVRSRQAFVQRPLKRQDDSKEAFSYDAKGLCLLTTLAMQAGDENFFELTIDGRLWNHPKFSTLNKVATIFHETAYKIDRDRTERVDSLRAQRTTELLLSRVEGETRTAWLATIARYGILGGESSDVKFVTKLISNVPAINGLVTADRFPSVHSEMLSLLRAELNSVASKYVVTPALLEFVDSMVNQLASTTFENNNATVERLYGLKVLTLGGPIRFEEPRRTLHERFAGVPGFDLFPPM